MTNFLGVDAARTFINESNGRFFRVRFIKRTDGSLRVMVARTGVRKGVKGVGMSFDPAKHNIVPVWDAQAQDFRMVNLEQVVDIQCGEASLTAQEKPAAREDGHNVVLELEPSAERAGRVAPTWTKYPEPEEELDAAGVAALIEGGAGVEASPETWERFVTVLRQDFGATA